MNKKTKTILAGTILGALWGFLSPFFIYLGLFLGFLSFHGYNEFSLFNTVGGYIILLLTAPFFIAGEVIRSLIDVPGNLIDEMQYPAWVLAVVIGITFGLIFSFIISKLFVRSEVKR